MGRATGDPADEARFLGGDPMRQIGQCLQAFNVLEALVGERIVQLVGAERRMVEPLLDALAAREKFQAYRRLLDEVDGPGAPGGGVPESGAAWLDALELIARHRNAIAHRIEGQGAPGPAERWWFLVECEAAIFGLRQALQSPLPAAKRRR